MELLYEASWREVTSGTYADPPPPVYKRSKSLRALQDATEQPELWEHRRGIGWTRKISHEEFVIPRPKLIVPVHTYGVRKRRTGAPASTEYEKQMLPSASTEYEKQMLPSASTEYEKQMLPSGKIAASSVLCISLRNALLRTH
ncbi:hypothetical protein L9F63_001478, partial [Diploptera punctata]